MINARRPSRLAVALALILVLIAATLILLRRPSGRMDAAASGGDAVLDANARTDAAAEQTPPGAALRATVEVAPLAVIERTNGSMISEPIQAELARVDPQADGWDSEAFSEQAAVQLKLLGKTLSEPNAAVPGSLLADEFRCGRLRPDPRDTVYRDARVAVSRARPTESPSPRSSREYAGVDGWAAAAAELLVPWFAADAKPHCHFKVIRVDLGGDSTVTTVQVQLAGRTSTGFVQQNVLWNCRWQGRSGQTPSLLAIDVEDFEEVVTNTAAGTLLVDCTESVLGKNDSFRRQLAFGVDHWRDRLDWRLGLDVAGPHGLAVGDVNGDGLDDLFLCEPGGMPNRLYLQQPDGSARDASADAGVDWLEPATSALLIDQDNDGDQDLLFTSGRFFVTCQNDGRGHFTLQNVITLAGVARSLVAADYDGDGDLDVYVCSYISRGVTLDDVGLGKPMPYHDANNGPANYLLAFDGSDGAWNYRDVTVEVGLDENNRRFSYAAAWEDYDNDGDSDLYVANDFGRNNLYRNDGGRFVDVAAAAGVEDIATGMSVSWGDYNRDGWPDLYVGNMFSSAGNRIMFQRRFQAGLDQTTRTAFQRLARGNSLFENAGDGAFRDVSLSAGVTLGRWAWSSNFVDLNNDGWEDLLVANGMITSAEDPGDL